MTRKEELETKTKKELSEICKDLGIPRYRGKSEIPKGEMIEAILKTEKEKLPEQKVKVQENVQSEEKIANKEGAEKKEKETAAEENKFHNKVKYIEEAEVGTIIAFYDESGKPNSAALVNRSVSRQMLKLVTQYGKEFIVPYNNVIWVRTTKIWPNKVYRLLKNKSLEVENEKE